MSEISERRVTIYPRNVEKADALMNALKARSLADMVNILIEMATAEQVTEVTFTSTVTQRSFVTRRRASSRDPFTSGYIP